MSATVYTQKIIPLHMEKFQQSLGIYSQYRDFNIDITKKTIDSKYTKTDDSKYSESSNFPNFPPGTTPPDDSFMRLVYLNYIASKSIVNSVEKLN